MELYIWTGNYTTYAAAQAAAAAHTPGAYAADSGVFLQSVAYVAGGPPPIPYGLTDMPATILTQNPVALMPGDANGDGKVDINDLTIVLAHYNQTLGPGSWAEGDFTGSGKVNINDLTIVLANYNHTSGAGSLAAVPEPTGVALLACAWLGGAGMRRADGITSGRPGMRRGMRALSAVAIVALAAGAAFASQLVEVSNTAQDPLFEGPGSPATFYSPMATAWGALWMNTGSGPFQYDIDQDINVQLNVQAPAPYGWTTIATYLVSDGTAKGDETTWNSPDQFNYPGMFTCGNSLEAGDPTIPGTGSGPGPSDQYNMELYIWTGNYTTYAAAQAAAAAHTAGAYIADSGVFNETVPLAIGPVEAQPLIGMPATILSQHPVTLVPGDANGDGRVDINDLTIVLSDFDRSVGSGCRGPGRLRRRRHG